MIQLKDVNKSYKVNKHHEVKALQNINLTINEGQLVVLKGKSGSGKSTILSVIAALSKPTSGEVIVDDKKISKLPDNFAALYRQDNIGFIFQKYNLIPNISVKDNILMPLIPKNPPQEFVEEQLDKTMKMFNIEHKKDIEVTNLSGGEQQRVAIARAHINDPKIIIADEPTANLDEALSKHFCKILKELKSKNKTIIVATHDPIFFDLDFVDEIIEIENGLLK